MLKNVMMRHGNAMLRPNKREKIFNKLTLINHKIKHNDTREIKRNLI